MSEKIAWVNVSEDVTDGELGDIMDAVDDAVEVDVIVSGPNVELLDRDEVRRWLNDLRETLEGSA